VSVEVLTEMATRRLEGRKAQLRQTIALDLLAASGSVTADEVEAELARQWVAPSPEQLMADVAVKCRAGVDYAEAELERAREAVNRLAEKLDRALAAVEAVQSSIDMAADDVAVKAVAVNDAKALADLAGQGVDLSAASPQTQVSVHAGVATGKAAVS
jgi:hypothetical protein